MGKGGSGQTWRPEFHHQHLGGGRRERTNLCKLPSDLHVPWHVHVFTHTISKHKSIFSFEFSFLAAVAFLEVLAVACGATPASKEGDALIAAESTKL